MRNTTKRPPRTSASEALEPRDTLCKPYWDDQRKPYWLQGVRRFWFTPKPRTWFGRRR
jgi:hypothetical protein